MENTTSNIQTSDTTISTPTTLPTTDKMVKIVIPDHTGHTTLNQPLDEAIDTIISNAFSKSKTVFLGTTSVFQFTAKNVQDTAALLKDALSLRALLLNEETPVVNLTGDLVGGDAINDSFEAKLSAIINEKIKAALEDQNAAILEKVQTAVTSAAAKLNGTTAPVDKDITGDTDPDQETYDISTVDLNDPLMLVEKILDLLELCQEMVDDGDDSGVLLTVDDIPTNIVVELNDSKEDVDDGGDEGIDPNSYAS